MSASEKEVAFYLTLVRHGQTESNKDGVIQGQSQDLDFPLSDKGVQQATLLGKQFSQEEFTHIFTSDLSRAKQTAEIILSENTANFLSIKTDARLRERNYGVAEGKTYAWVKRSAQVAGTTVPAYTPPGAESLEQMRQRAAEFFKTISCMVHKECSVGAVKKNQQLKTLNILAVSHGGLIRELMRHLVSELGSSLPPGTQVNKVYKMSPNTGVSKFKVVLNMDCVAAKGNIDCLMLHNSEHLMQ